MAEETIDKRSSRIARIAAYYADGLVVGVFVFILQLAAGPISDSTIIVFLVTILGSYGYYVYFTVKRGATLGKEFFGLKVVNFEGAENITIRTGVMREVLGKIVSGVVLSLGYLWILWDKDRQGWHDKIAKTKVLQVKPLGGFKKFVAYLLALLLPIIGIVAIVLSLLLVAVNPAKQFEKAQEYSERLNQQFPAGLTEKELLNLPLEGE